MHILVGYFVYVSVFREMHGDDNKEQKKNEKNPYCLDVGRRREGRTNKCSTFLMDRLPDTNPDALML